MLSRDRIEAMIPHKGGMCLWDEVVEWDARRIALRADNHRDVRHPLRSHDRLRAVHLCEYGAQAMAVHGGLLAQAAGARATPGLLVSLRSVLLHVDHVEDLRGELRVTARRLLATPESWQYEFRVEHQGRLLAEGRAAVMMRPGTYNAGRSLSAPGETS